MQNGTGLDKRRIGNLVVDPRTYADGGTTYDDTLARLRRDAPVYWVEPDRYRPFWLITKHADIRAIEGKPSRFLSRPRSFLMTREDEEELIKATGSASTDSLLDTRSRILTKPSPIINMDFASRRY